MSALQDRTLHPDIELLPPERAFAQQRVLLLFAVGLAIAVVLKLAEWHFMHSLDLEFDPWALAALPLAQFLLGTNWRMAVLTCLAGEVLCAASARYVPALAAFAFPIGLGLASFAVLSATMLFSPKQRGSALLMLAAGSLVIIGQQISEIGQAFTTADLWTFDNRAYLVDLSFGFNPVTSVIDAVDALPMVLRTCVSQMLGLAYASIMLVMAWVVLLHLRARSPRWALALTAMLLAGAVGGSIYHIFPAAGPGFAFPSFPAMPSPATSSAAAAPVDPHLPRNCMPSLHTTWALLIVINTGGLARMLRLCAVAFAACIIVSTLMLGQHYLIDLIVAYFAVAIQELARSLLCRQLPRAGFWIGGACVAAWLFVLVAHVGWLLDGDRITLTASAATLTLSMIAYGRHATIERKVGQSSASYIAPSWRRMTGTIFSSST